MPNVSLFNEYSAEDQAIARRRKMAEMLQQQSMTPLESSSANGWVIPTSPLAGLAKLLQGYSAGKMTSAADEQQKALGQRYQTEGQDALVRGLRAYRGTPENAPESVGGEPAVGPTRPAVPGSPEAAMGIWGGHPMTQGASQAMLAQMLKGEEPYSLAPDAKRMKGDKVIATNPKPVVPKEHVIGGKVYESGAGGLKDLGGPGEGTWSEPYNLNGAMVQRNTSTGQIKQAVNREPNIRISNPLAAYSNVQPDGKGGYIGLSKTSGQMEQIPTEAGVSKVVPDKPITEVQGKANLYQSRAVQAAKVIDEMEGKYSPAEIAVKQGLGKVWGVGGALEAGANTMMPGKTQKVEQAQRNFINAILRQESGAAIADSEFANAQKQYFPQPGDAKQVIQQKKQNRETAIAGLQVMAGPAMKRRASDQPGAVVDFNSLPQ